jgi:Ala-tRNA(Pro) deacylase
VGGLERLRQYLDEEQAPYEVREHAEAYTTQEIASLEHVAGRRMAKVVMVVADTDLLMLVLPAPEQVDMAKVAYALGRPAIRLAHEEEFAPAFPDCQAGAMPPFGNLYRVPVYIDRALTLDQTIVFQAGTHRHTVEMAFADFERLVQPTIAELASPPHPSATAPGP